MLREVKVGALVVTAFAVLGLATFLVSEKSNLFTRKNRYSIQFATVAGLVTSSPVQLNGVNVGSVESIALPRSVEEELLTVWISADRRYASLIREDSIARIKTLGLLGDKYIDITSGSAATSIIPSGGAIPAAPPTDVERLIATGGDAVENVVAISYSLRNILSRMEAGEGILGELTTDSEAGARAKQALVNLVETVESLTKKLNSGEGTLARLINDDALVESFESSARRLDGVLASVEGGQGLLPALLTDPETKQRVDDLLTNLQATTADLSSLLRQVEDGEGLLATLIQDESFAQQLTLELQQLVHNLAVVSQKLADGEGTLGMLIEDPSVYEAVNDVIVGIDESPMLRWLVRSRQKKGIKQRYEAEQELLEGESRAVDDTASGQGE